MGSTPKIVGEVVAPTSLAEVSTPSAARGGESTLVSAMGGEVTTPSTVPRGGVAVHASSASASPTTCGSGDLVREGDDGATRTSSKQKSDKKYKDRTSPQDCTSSRLGAESSAKTPEAS
jgi:hypothetical protein